MLPLTSPNLEMAKQLRLEMEMAANNIGQEEIDVVGDGGIQINPSVVALPATQNSKKYHCQRCLNHGLQITRKNHKRDCLYQDCECDDCKLVSQRKLLNREVNRLRQETGEITGGITESIGPIVDDFVFYHKERSPKCARCRAHNPEDVPPPLKGHKKICPYKACKCRKCELITSRRDVMAQQIRLRRKQLMKRTVRKPIARWNQGSETHSPPATSNGSSPPAAMPRHGMDEAGKKNQLSTNDGIGLNPIAKKERSDCMGMTSHQIKNEQCSNKNIALIKIDDSSSSPPKCICKCNSKQPTPPTSQVTTNPLPPYFPTSPSDMAIPQIFAHFIDYMKSTLMSANALQWPGPSTGGLNLPTTPAASHFENFNAMHQLALNATNGAMLPTIDGSSRLPIYSMDLAKLSQSAASSIGTHQLNFLYRPPSPMAHQHLQQPGQVNLQRPRPMFPEIYFRQ